MNTTPTSAELLPCPFCGKPGISKEACNDHVAYAELISDLTSLGEKLNAHWGDSLFIDASDLMAVGNAIEILAGMRAQPVPAADVPTDDDLKILIEDFKIWRHPEDRKAIIKKIRAMLSTVAPPPGKQTLVQAIATILPAKQEPECCEHGAYPGNPCLPCGVAVPAIQVQEPTDDADQAFEDAITKHTAKVDFGNYAQNHAYQVGFCEGWQARPPVAQPAEQRLPCSGCGLTHIYDNCPLPTFAQPEQTAPTAKHLTPGAEPTVPLSDYKTLQALVTSQGIRLMEYESEQPAPLSDERIAYIYERTFNNMPGAMRPAPPPSHLVFVFAREVRAYRPSDD